MRRVLVAAATVILLAAGWLVSTGANGTEGGYRVDAIFDSASFLIPGQDVKIAGARVGEVVDVTLTPDNKARIEMAIDPRFAPLRDDADCTIQPQSLIGEKFIQCTPGTPRGNELEGSGGRPPTIPIENTHSPVDIDLVLATFRRPTNERLALLVNELGGGLAARGEDLNAIIRRANPALQETNRVLRIVDRDRRRLRSLIRASDRVVGELAARKERVKDVIDEGAAVAGAAAGRRERIEEAVEDLPELLTEAQPALRDLETLARDGTPVLRDLRVAAPQLRRLARDAAPLADAARPALTRLGTASKVGERALRDARPVLRQLRRFARAARPTGVLVNDLFQSMRARGVVEGLQDFVYYAALATSRFDRYSHTLPAHLLGSDCSQYATTPSEACDAHFASFDAKATTRTKARRTHKGDRSSAPREAPRETTPPAAPDATPQEKPAVPEPRPDALPPALQDQLDDLLDELPPLPGGGGDERTARDLLDFLLG